MQLKRSVQKKRPELIIKKGVVFYHNNATFLTTRQKLKELGWEVLIYPPYSPNLIPSNYYLFRSLWHKLDIKEGLFKSLVLIFCPEIPKILRRWNNGFIRKMAKDHRSKRRMLNLKKNFFLMYFNYASICKKTFSLTQYLSNFFC